MAVANSNLLLLSDFCFWVNQLGLSNGDVVAGPFPALISGRKTASRRTVDLFFTISPMDLAGELFDLRRIYKNRAITSVQYQMYHIPSHSKSAAYEHEFKDEVCEVGGNPQLIGRVKMFPGEHVWPEMTEKGWYGDLPQFNK